MLGNLGWLVFLALWPNYRLLGDHPGTLPNCTDCEISTYFLALEIVLDFPHPVTSLKDTSFTIHNSCGGTCTENLSINEVHLTPQGPLCFRVAKTSIEINSERDRVVLSLECCRCLHPRILHCSWGGGRLYSWSNIYLYVNIPYHSAYQVSSHCQKIQIKF